MTRAEINHQAKDCRNVLGLLDLLITLPATSVECERGFSSLRLIKSDWRNRLSSESLNAVMRIYLDSPAEENFNPSHSGQFNIAVFMNLVA